MHKVTAMRHSRLTTLLLMLVLLLTTSFSCFAKSQPIYDYDIVCAGNGEYGHYLVKVSVVVPNKKNITPIIVKQHAVHGIIYKGYSGENGCSSQKALIGSSQLTSEQQSAIEKLISEDYGMYASSVGNAINVVKVKKGYQVTAVIEVNAGSLRNRLESMGVIRKLGL